MGFFLYLANRSKLYTQGKLIGMSRAKPQAEDGCSKCILITVILWCYEACLCNQITEIISTPTLNEGPCHNKNKSSCRAQTDRLVGGGCFSKIFLFVGKERSKTTDDRRHQKQVQELWGRAVPGAGTKFRKTRNCTVKKWSPVVWQISSASKDLSK